MVGLSLRERCCQSRAVSASPGPERSSSVGRATPRRKSAMQAVIWSAGGSVPRARGRALSLVGEAVAGWGRRRWHCGLQPGQRRPGRTCSRGRWSWDRAGARGTGAAPAAGLAGGVGGQVERRRRARQPRRRTGRPAASAAAGVGRRRCPRPGASRGADPRLAARAPRSGALPVVRRRLDQRLRQDDDGLGAAVDVGLQLHPDAVAAGQRRDHEQADPAVPQQLADVRPGRVGQQAVHPLLVGGQHAQAAVLDLDG